MASVRKEIDISLPLDDAWDALRDFGAVHARVAPGFVTDCRLDGDDRIVTFTSGTVVRERLVALDDRRRRLVYSVVEGPLGLDHHQASVELVERPDGAGGCRLLWTTDLLPDTAAPVVDGLMDQGAAAIARAMAR